MRRIKSLIPNDFSDCQRCGTGLDTPTGMQPSANPLVRHLTLAVVLKLVVLMALWWAFVRDGRIDVDATRTATHLSTAAEASPQPSAPNGAQP